MTCKYCQWWDDPDRPHETFVWLRWEWDIDKAAAMKPAEQGEIEVAKIAHVVDYPKKEGMFPLFRAPVRDEHIDHVPLDVPLLMGLVKVEEETIIMVIDGHHRLARAIKEGVKTLPYRLLDEKQLMACAISKPPKRRKSR